MKHYSGISIQLFIFMLASWVTVSYGQVTNLSATSDATNVYYSFSYPGTPSFLRVFLDTDGSSATGYPIKGIGASLMIENNNLYRYSGSGGSWAWTYVGASDMVKSAPNVKWRIARSILGSSAGINLVGNYDNTYYSASLTQSLSSSVTWTVCASENGTCNYSGNKIIRYGANGTFVTKPLVGPIACNNTTFGDPLVGVVKHCDLSSDVVGQPVPTPAPTPVPTPTPAPAPGPASSGNFTKPMLVNPVSPLQYGAKCDGVTDDTAAFQAAINASDVLVPGNRTCVINRTLLITTSHKHFECQAGTILQQTTLSRFASTEQSNMFRIAGNGRISGDSIVGCYLRGTNTVIPTYSQGDNVHHYNAAVITRDYVDDFFLAGNTFDRWLGQAAFQTMGNIDGGHGDQIIYNTFKSCGLYGAVFVAHQNGLMANNTLVDCAAGVENDNATQLSGGNVLDSNTLTCVYGYGAPDMQACTLLTGGGTVNGANYSTNIVRNNSVSGVSLSSGFQGANGSRLIIGKGWGVLAAQYTNNSCTNGCGVTP